MNSHSSSVSSNPEDSHTYDFTQHNIAFSDTLSRRTKASNPSSASKLAQVSEKVNARVRTGYQTEIPAFSQSHTELRELAEYCQGGGVQLAEIKNYSAQSLASVAYRINSASNLILELLSAQCKQFGELAHETNLLEQRVRQFQERRARHRIAPLTSDKKTVYMRRVAPPPIKERPQAYVRKPIDFSAYDKVGRGFFYEVDRTERYEGPCVPLTLNGDTGEEPPQVFPRIAGGPIRNGESNTFTIANTKLSNGSTDIYHLPITTFQPTNNRTKLLQAKSHSIPVYFPAYNVSDLALNRNPSPDVDTLRQGHTAESLYDYITPVSRNTPTQWERSSESASCSGDKDSIRPDESLPDLLQLPPPPDYLLTSSPTLSSTHPPPTYERMNSHEKMNSHEMNLHERMNSHERHSPVLEMVQPAKQKLHRIPSNYIEKVVTLYAYIGQRYDELSFEPGDVIYVIKKNEDGWFEGFLNGYRGLFPGNYADLVC